jgi:response regulator of citrate/malate metabolism
MNKKHDTETSELERKVRTAWSNRETATDAEQLRLIDAVMRAAVFLKVNDEWHKTTLGQVFERMYMTETDGTATQTELAAALHLSRSTFIRHCEACSQLFLIILNDEHITNVQKLT